MVSRIGEIGTSKGEILLNFGSITQKKVDSYKAIKILVNETKEYKH